MAMDLKWLLSADDKASPVFDKIKSSATGAASGVEGAFSGAMGKFNLLTGAVGTMMTVAMGGAFAKVIKETISWTGEAVALSKALGITTQQASILNVALGDVYLTKETMLAGSSRIAKTLIKEEEAFTRLGVATRDQSGHYRNTLDIMTDVNTKLGNLAEGTDRNIAGMSIYGKSWGELAGLIKLNSEVMKEAAIKAKELGLEVGDEAVASMKKYKAGLNDIEDVGKSLAVRFGNVLLPALIQVGAYLGKNGPILSDAFKWSLDLLGKTATTAGEWIGLMAYRMVTAGSAVKNAVTGNFSQAITDLKNMVAAGDDFNSRTKAKWGDWSSPEITSKSKGGEQLEKMAANLEAASAAVGKYATSITNLGKVQLDYAKTGFSEDLQKQQELLKANKLNMDTLETPLRSYLAVVNEVGGKQLKMQKDVSQSLNMMLADKKTLMQQDITIATTEKTLMEARLGAWTQYLTNLKAMHATTVADMAKKQQELFDIKVNTSNLLLQVSQTMMTPIQKYYSTVADLEQKQNIAMTLSGDEKIKLLGTIQQTWASLTNEIKQGDTVMLSQSDAVATAYERIRSLGETMQLEKSKQIDALSTSSKQLETAMKDAAAQVAIYQASVIALDMSILALTRKFDLSMTDNATPVINAVSAQLDKLRDKTITITANYVSSYGDTSIPSYDVGTPYVPKTGLALIHKGERIITARDNASGGSSNSSTINAGGITINVTGGDTSTATVREMARKLMPEMQQLQQRYRR